MKYPNVFQLISKEFAKVDIAFLLVGGFAVNHYKVGRGTRDVDFLMTEENYDQKARQILIEGGYQEFRRERVCARLKNNAPFFMTVDILFTDPDTMKEMLENSQAVTVHGEPFKVPSLEHLIAMKLHALKQSPGEREYKDLLDILELIRMNRIDVRSEGFHGLCLKYGTEDLYRKIRELKSQ